MSKNRIAEFHGTVISYQLGESELMIDYEQYLDFLLKTARLLCCLLTLTASVLFKRTKLYPVQTNCEPSNSSVRGKKSTLNRCGRIKGEQCNKVELHI